MRHLKRKGRKFGRIKKKRKALLHALVSSLILREKIKTTEAKAKELIKFTDRLISLAKAGKKRELTKLDLPRNVLAKLTEEIKNWYPKRETGYTTRVALHYRKGDCSKVMQVSLLPRVNIEKTNKGKK